MGFRNARLDTVASGFLLPLFGATSRTCGQNFPQNRVSQCLVLGRIWTRVGVYSTHEVCAFNIRPIQIARPQPLAYSSSNMPVENSFYNLTLSFLLEKWSKAQGLDSDSLELKRLCCLLAIWLWPSDLTSLCLSSLNCEMGIILGSSWGRCENQMR